MKIKANLRDLRGTAEQTKGSWKRASSGEEAVFRKQQIKNSNFDERHECR